MQLRIRGREIYLTDEIKQYVEEKTEKLTKYGIEILTADVVLEENHNKTEDKAAEVKMLLKVPGKDIEAIGTGKTIFAAINEAQEKAASQLSRRNEKIESRNRQGKSKNIFRRWLGK